jgi:cystathionine beta-synthase
VPLPDTGRAYISKFFSDEWMRDNGFPLSDTPAAGAATVRDLLGGRRGKVVTARKGERVETVVKRLKAHDVSQLPVVDEAGRAIGMIHEYDLLSETVDPLVQPLQGVVELDTPVARLRDIFNDDNVAVVKEGDQVTGILTKIDLIEFLGQRLG